MFEIGSKRFITVSNLANYSLSFLSNTSPHPFSKVFFKVLLKDTVIDKKLYVRSIGQLHFAATVTTQNGSYYVKGTVVAKKKSF